MRSPPRRDTAPGAASPTSLDTPTEFSSGTTTGTLAWLNGIITPIEEARVSILDRGFLFGDGVYELVRFFAGVGVQMEDHVNRLERSLRESRISGFDARAMPRICDELLAAAGLVDASVYLQVTRGVAATRHHVPAPGMTPTVAAIATALPPLSAFDRPEPVRAALVEDPRWRRCDIKSISLMGGILALLEAGERIETTDAGGGIEAILHRAGVVGEGTATNVLIRVGDELATPPVDGEPPILHGVTRLLVDGAGETIGRRIHHRVITVDELRHADEIMVLSSRRIVAPVIELDGRPVGDGRPGPATIALFDAARRRIASLCGVALPAPASAIDSAVPARHARTPEIARP